MDTHNNRGGKDIQSSVGYSRLMKAGSPGRRAIAETGFDTSECKDPSADLLLSG